MVAGADILDHCCGAFGKEASEKDRAFDLPTGDGRAVGDAFQIAVTLDHTRRAGIFALGMEVCPHEAERIDDALHRTLR